MSGRPKSVSAYKIPEEACGLPADPSATEGLLTQGRSSWWMRLMARMFEKRWRSVLTLVILDMLAGTLGLMMALWIHFNWLFPYAISGPGTLYELYFPVIINYLIYLSVILFLNGGYRQIGDTRPEDQLRAILKANFLATLLILSTIFFFKKSAALSRFVVIAGFFFSSSMLILFRFGLRELLKSIWSYGLARQNVVVVGDSLNNIRWVLAHLHIQRYKGFNLLGYLAENPAKMGVTGLPYMGKFSDLENIKETMKIDRVFFAMRYDSQRHSLLFSRLEKCNQLKLPVLIISEIFNNFYFSLRPQDYAGIFEISRRKPAYSRPFFLLIKRIIDIGGSLLILLITIPIWIVAVIAIKLDDRGPIFYHARRPGQRGKVFYALKFRTMVVGAKEVLHNNPELFSKFQEKAKLKDDPRITRIGRWLRRTSLDELPQLINILKGEMSLVGPRAVIDEQELEQYGDFKEERMKLRPGLTGYWQVQGRSTTTYEERIHMDRFYAYNCSFWLDLLILLKTPLVVITGHGAV